MGSLILTIAVSVSFLVSFPPLLQSQQPYEGLSISDCGSQHNASSLLGYFCNGYSDSCRTFLTFHSQPPYNSVESISALLNSDRSQLSRLNPVSLNSAFPTNTKVIVPVTCSCSGFYYQANSSYVVKEQDTYFTIANDTFQGLSSCQALERQNYKSSSNGYLYLGMEMLVPLRCACPTTRQRGVGFKYLLSYLVETQDTLFDIGQKFGASIASIFDANGLSETNTNIYPFTTLLIPLKTQPNSSQLTKPSSPPNTTPPSSPSYPKKSNRTLLYVGIGVALLLCLIILSLIVLCFLLKVKKKKKKKKKDNKITDRPDANSSSELFVETFLSSMSDVGQCLKVYKFKELQLATENFICECRIEGSVYRGVINGDFAAIKMMNRDVSNEIEMLKKANHSNLIRLSGLCFNLGHWFLVYEYAQNGSLSNWIFDRSGNRVLSWKKRVQIALDVANGLHYLHSYTEPPYVHKDIKSSNILLDGNFRGKIANFGLARPARGEEGEFALTRHIVGTKGYMSPEYLEHGLISTKLDVYAFGVLMLELITGRDAASLQNGEDGVSSEHFVAMLTEEEKAKEKMANFVDSALEGDFPLDSAIFMAKLIEACLRKDAANRPNMGETVHSLSKLLASSLSMDSSSSVSKCQSFRSDDQIPANNKTVGR